MAELYVLAITLGAGFGVFAYLMRTTAARLAIFLFVLYVFQSAAQQGWRALEKGGDWDEFLRVAALRLVFAGCAVVVVWVLNRWRP